MTNFNPSETVGIKGLRYPVTVREKSGGLQDTVAEVNLQVTLPQRHHSTCLNIFYDILSRYQSEMSNRIFRRLLAEVKEKLEARSAHIEMSFPYFLKKKAPVSATPGLMEYRCRFTGGMGEGEDFMLSVWVPVTTLCPCSKEISEYGAHNQRAEINLNVKYSSFVWLEDLIAIAENSASCQLYSVLKRPDEKFVTENAYQNPMFVEDVVRKVAEESARHPGISWFSVGAESFESIHKHSAYAFVNSDDMQKAPNNNTIKRSL